MLYFCLPFFIPWKYQILTWINGKQNIWYRCDLCSEIKTIMVRKNHLRIFANDYFRRIKHKIITGDEAKCRGRHEWCWQKLQLQQRSISLPNGMDETWEIEKSVNHGYTYSKKYVSETIILSENINYHFWFFKKYFPMQSHN